MAKLNLVLTNGGMQLELIAVIGDNAFLKRLNDSSFIVCRGITIHNDFTCEWDYALGYFERYNDAYKCFNDKVVTEFQEYLDVIPSDNKDDDFEEDICSDDDFEGMTIEDLTGIPYNPLT